MQLSAEAYLDIETTGLSPEFDEITVIGIHLCHGDDTKFIQLVGKDVTKDNVLEALAGVGRIYTYNGSRLFAVHPLLPGNKVGRVFSAS